jgi:hypothetical protein
VKNYDAGAVFLWRRGDGRALAGGGGHHAAGARAAGSRTGAGHRMAYLAANPEEKVDMASVNKVILVGNLGADPEVRYLPSGEAVANIRIATTDTWKDKDGNKQEATEWHRVSFFGRQAESRGQYLKKGRRSMSRAPSAPANGRTRKARTATRPRSSAIACRCSAAARA